MKKPLTHYLYEAFPVVMIAILAFSLYQMQRCDENLRALRRWRDRATSTLGGNQNALAPPLRDGAGWLRVGSNSPNAPTAQVASPTNTQTSAE